MTLYEEIIQKLQTNEINLNGLTIQEISNKTKLTIEDSKKIYNTLLIPENILKILRPPFKKG